ncbi:MAG: hypothetical protein L6R41_000528 [Letrouitia leprolyta]|nr:MAG: hypothetical protein L6R41_000528 [Letrouitia leprolyta]
MERSHWQLVYHHWSNGVKQNLKCTEEGFAKNGIKEKRLNGGRKIGIQAINTEGFVVFEMIRLDHESAFKPITAWVSYRSTHPKSSTVWQSDGQIGENSKEAIGRRRSKGEIIQDWSITKPGSAGNLK